MKSLVNTVFSNSKVQFTFPKGDKLLPGADLTYVFDNEHMLLNVVFYNKPHSYNF